MQSYIVLDLETTGLRPTIDQILEIGALKVEDGQITDRFQELLDPGVQIPYAVQNLTGITQAMAQDAGKKLSDVFPAFLEFSGELPLLGHNILFDYSFLKQQAINRGISFLRSGVDTLKIARKVLPDLESKSLTSLCHYYKVKQESAHRALDDVESTWQVYRCMQEEFGEKQPEMFWPAPLHYAVKKQSGITTSQKVYLNDLIKYHRIETDVTIEDLTKNEASRMIDRIILNYGRIKR